MARAMLLPDPNVWSGRALQEDFSKLGDVRSAFVLRAIMGISVRAVSLTGRWSEPRAA